MQTTRKRGKVYVWWWELRAWVDVMFELEVQFSKRACVDAGVAELYLSHFPDMKRLFVWVRLALQGLCLRAPAHLAKASSSVAWSDWWWVTGL
jgi:hypothetical protein